ncbi:Uncharacterised protein [Clostridium putrefaciens]|uniref:Uncharacterized protein n=1 Tax=Clostridium putrefaciens TaxID=99675 RepID=A0A381JA33_9CLOT|nr:hypothetical protein [Clostridium putrefaciens]SUY48071.1 Uncharacterised protein [Clostridium putrefaciens]
MSSYALQLPNNYVEIEREEMEYVDGGAYLSNAGLRSVLLACALNPVGATILGLAYWKAVSFVTAKFTLLCAKLGSVGGIAGSIIGAVVGAYAAGSVAISVVDALYSGQGLDFGFTWRPTIDVR